MKTYIYIYSDINYKIIIYNFTPLDFFFKKKLIITCILQGVILLTIATTLNNMRPPECDNYRQNHHNCIPASGKQLVLLFIALYTIATGGGGIKANVSGFGSDQFDHRDPKEEKAMIFFFNRFYFCISIGSLFAVTVLVYVQDNVGRGWGYGVSGATMVMAVMILLIGTPLYRYRRPKGSPLAVIWRVVVNAWKKRYVAYPDHPSLLNEYHTSKVPYTEYFRYITLSIFGKFHFNLFKFLYEFSFIYIFLLLSLNKCK